MMITTIWTRPDGTKFRADPTQMHTYTNCRLETREPTKEELATLYIPEKIIRITIPKDKYLTNEMQQFVMGFRTIYSGLVIKTHGEETTIDNIDLADIKKYVSKEQYQWLLSIGTKFPPEVTEFFSLPPKKEDAQTP